jgi:hypothetical protein
VIENVPEVPTGDAHTKVHVSDAAASLTGRTRYNVSAELGDEEFAKSCSICWSTLRGND